MLPIKARHALLWSAGWLHTKHQRRPRLLRRNQRQCMRISEAGRWHLDEAKLTEENSIYLLL